jgi:hypothetical protein
MKRGDRMTKKIKMRGRCRKKGKCDRDKYNIMMQAVNSRDISFCVQD